MKMFVYVIDSDVRGIVSAVDQEEAAKKVMNLVFALLFCKVAKEFIKRILSQM